MLKTWRIQGPNETCIIAPRSLLSQEEQAAYLSAQIDRWLADPLTRRTVMDIYGSIRGHSELLAKRLQGQEVHRYVKSEILQAFRRGEFVLMRMPHLSIFPTLTPSREQKEQLAEEPPPVQESPSQQKSWVGIELVDQDGKPVPNARYVLELPDGTKRSGRLDSNGTLQVRDINPGTCKVWFPDYDSSEWHGGAEVDDGTPAAPAAAASEEPSLTQPVAAQAAPSPAPAPKPSVHEPGKNWVELELVDGDGNPVPDARYKLCLPDGTEREGVLGKDGRGREDGIDHDMIKVTFPDFDAAEWEAV